MPLPQTDLLDTAPALPAADGGVFTWRAFLQRQWAAVALFGLFLLLGAAHAFMIHYNRAPSQIQWAENMITGTFTALIAKLK